MVTVPILGMHLHPRDRSPAQFYYISIRGSESESEPVEKLSIMQDPSPNQTPSVQISQNREGGGECYLFFDVGDPLVQDGR